MISIANIQLNSQNDLSDNADIIWSAVHHAKTRGADIVVLPENAFLMGRQAVLAPHFDYLSHSFSNLAKECEVVLIAGTLPCPFDMNNRPLGGDKFFQTSLAFDSTGECIGRYDKIHLFRANVNDGVGSYDESRTFLAGNSLTLAKTTIRDETINIGMMICFDLRFPKMAQMYRQMGADILVAPSAFTYETGRANWNALLKARALDSQCLVVGSAQGGTHYTEKNKRQTWGHSTTVGADGIELANTGRTECGSDGYLVVITEFFKDKQEQIRQNLPIFDCARLF